MRAKFIIDYSLKVRFDKKENVLKISDHLLNKIESSNAFTCAVARTQKKNNAGYIDSSQKTVSYSEYRFHRLHVVP